jgi:glutaminase
VCDDLSRYFDLHLFNTPHASKSVIRLKFTAGEVNSNRIRTAEEAEALRVHGKGIQVFQLQGNLVLSTAEVVVHDVMSALAGLDAVILDFKHVLSVNESASRLFYQLLLKLQEQGKQIAFTNIARAPQLRRYMKLKLLDQFDKIFLTFDDNDTALEWCENRLLAKKIVVRVAEQTVGAVDYDLLAGLSSNEVVAMRALLERRKFKPGEVIVPCGALAGELYFLARGCASATLMRGNGAMKRLGTFSPGMAFGEMAILDRSPRSAAVTADTDVECDLLKLEDFEKLGETHPRIKLVLLRNLALGLSRNLRKRNQEFSVFDY